MSDFLLMANKYILFKRVKDLFCHQGRLNHYKSLNLLCTYTIWLFTAFAQINTGNSQQIICIKIHFSAAYLPLAASNGSLPSILGRKNEMSRSISKQAYGKLYWVFLSHWYSLFNNLQCSQFLYTLFL